MFASAELGASLSKDAFDDVEPSLRRELQALQRQAAAAKLPVVVLVDGVEGAGKGEVINRLGQWMDARNVETTAFWAETDAERCRPRWWRFWRALPPAGTVGLWFGSWLTRPVHDHATGQLDTDAFDHALHRVVETERMLIADGVCLVKLWFHLSRGAQRDQLAKERKGKTTPTSPFLADHARRYEAFVASAEHALRATDTARAPWQVIEAEDDRYRDVTAARTLSAAMAHAVAHEATDPPPAPIPETPSVLATVDLSPRLERSVYKKRLKAAQRDLFHLGWKAHAAGIPTVVALEGWDAAGKGGAIRRLMAGLDLRLAQVHRIAAPTDEERAHPWLWRFWRRVPMAGHVAVFDRTWYGRVLVERVEGFATPADWQRAYREIDSFEAQLVERGTVLVKGWLHLDPDEQLRRFRARETTPHKRHKITDDDWRNRERWDAYEAAVDAMLARTSPPEAPWTVVAANDKLHARVTVVETVRDRLAEALDRA